MEALTFGDLAAAHGCPHGCAACAAAAREARGTDSIGRWAVFVTSESADRIAAHAARHGFPDLSPDPVIQFLLEEALDARHEAAAPGDTAGASGGPGAVPSTLVRRAEAIRRKQAAGA